MMKTTEPFTTTKLFKNLFFKACEKPFPQISNQLLMRFDFFGAFSSLYRQLQTVLFWKGASFLLLNKMQ